MSGTSLFRFLTAELVYPSCCFMHAATMKSQEVTQPQLACDMTLQMATISSIWVRNSSDYESIGYLVIFQSQGDTYIQAFAKSLHFDNDWISGGVRKMRLWQFPLYRKYIH